MDLVKIYETVKKQEKSEELIIKEIRQKQELRNIIADIVLCKEIFYTNDKELCETLGVKYDKNNSYLGLCSYSYKFKLNKSNITKIQKYINDGGIL